MSTMVLVMENLNLHTITTQIHFAIDMTNKTQNFQNTSGNYKRKAPTSLQNGVPKLMPQRSDVGQESVIFV